MRFSMICILLFSSAVSQAQDWPSINLGTTEDLNKIYFLDDSKGFIVGDNGALYGTSDGGASWTNIPTGVSHNLETISFSNSNIGFINGLKTIDGGVTWTVQSSSQDFILIKALANGNLMAGSGSLFSGDIYQSTDSGATWLVIANPIPTGFYTDEYFIDDNIGYITSWYSGHMAKTEDGGDSWTDQYIDAEFISSIGDVWGISFPSADVGIIAGHFLIGKTDDGGATWSNLYSLIDPLALDPYGIFCPSEDHYIVVGGKVSAQINTILESIDGGATWTHSNNSTNILQDVTCTNNDCFAVGYNGTVLKKNNPTSGDAHIYATQNDITIYPNPFQNQVIVDGDFTDYQIAVFDAAGTLVQDYTNANSPLTIDLSSFGMGMYFISIEHNTNSSLSIYKIIKQ